MRSLRFLAFTTLMVARPAFAQVRAPNEHGRIPVLVYHLITDADTRWGRSHDGFRRDLALLYARGYRPITVSQLARNQIDIPAGTSPVAITFDDASPGQFEYIERNGALVVDPNSAVGIWIAFNRTHPDWRMRATFCLLSNAMAGHAFFGNKGIDGQKTEWRFLKLGFLAKQGFELCDHTLWHANLRRYGDAKVQEQIARGVLAIDSAVAGYAVRTLAVPLGLWPRNGALARKGQWTDPRSGQVVTYKFDAVLAVTGGASPSPRDPAFRADSIPRIQVIGDNLAGWLDQIEATRYVAGGKSRATAAIR